MSALDDVKNSTQSTRDVIDAARHRTEQALHETQHKAQQAAGLACKA